jgi:hypothetical protein
MLKEAKHELGERIVFLETTVANLQSENSGEFFFFISLSNSF